MERREAGTQGSNCCLFQTFPRTLLRRTCKLTLASQPNILIVPLGSILQCCPLSPTFPPWDSPVSAENLVHPTSGVKEPSVV